MIAFSTDASVAARGVYLLSFLPETDVRRIVDYAVSRGKRSFAALMPDNAYGAVVEAAFQQEVARRGGRVVALEKYPLDPASLPKPVRRVAQAATQRRRDLHSRRCRLGAAGGAGAGRRPASICKRRATARHRPVGRSAHLRDAGVARRLVSRRPIRPAYRNFSGATAPATGRTRCAPRRSPMTRWRWSPRW